MSVTRPIHVPGAPRVEEPRTKYFKLSEWRCRDGRPYPAEWLDRWYTLAHLCDTIRAAWGAPLTVMSGYRSPAYNRRIGGAKHSQHMLGTAADLRTMNPKSAPSLHRLVLELYAKDELPDLGGLGLYTAGGFCHVDIRPGARLARWTGSRVGA